ncbi:Meiotic recombination protein dmc1 [Orobanche minor]
MMVTKDLQGLLKWHIRGIGRSSLRVKKLIHAQPLVMKKLPNNMKRGNGNVAIIDRDGTSGSDHIIVPTAERFGMDAGAVIDNDNGFNNGHVSSRLHGQRRTCSQTDSLNTFCTQKLAQIFSRLTKIANYYNDAVYMTNQVMDDPLFFTLRSLTSHTKYRPSEAKVYKICEAVKKIMRKAVISILTGTQSPDSLLGDVSVLNKESKECA